LLVRKAAYAPSILVGPPSSLTFTVDEGRGYGTAQDLAVTKDGALICLHDDSLERTTNAAEAYDIQIAMHTDGLNESCELHETVEVARAAPLEALDRAMGMAPGTLAALNPELRRNATPDAPYQLKVPPASGATLLASLDTLPKWTPPPVAMTATHRVRSGETLSQIATLYRTSVSRLMDLNRLRRADRLSIGQVLQVPGSGRTGSSSEASPPKVASVARSDVPAGTLVQYRVRSGDNLWLIAARYGTTVERIRDDNGLRSNFLQIGQVLAIRAGSS